MVPISSPSVQNMAFRMPFLFSSLQLVKKNGRVSVDALLRWAKQLLLQECFQAATKQTGLLGTGLVTTLMVSAAFLIA